MKIVATIEARMNSSRLPGKVLMDIGGLRSLECQIRRMRRSRYIDEIIIATTVNSCDDEIVDFSKNEGVAVYRGSENDVMSRILEAATSINGDLQIQITGDCPLIDPKIVDDVIRAYKSSDADYVSNVNPPTYPDGLDVEVFSFSALEDAWKGAETLFD